jgi:hypothetical protein
VAEAKAKAAEAGLEGTAAELAALRVEGALAAQRSVAQRTQQAQQLAEAAAATERRRLQLEATEATLAQTVEAAAEAAQQLQVRAWTGRRGCAGGRRRCTRWLHEAGLAHGRGGQGHRDTAAVTPWGRGRAGLHRSNSWPSLRGHPARAVRSVVVHRVRTAEPVFGASRREIDHPTSLSIHADGSTHFLQALRAAAEAEEEEDYASAADDAFTPRSYTNSPRGPLSSPSTTLDAATLHSVLVESEGRLQEVR